MAGIKFGDFGQKCHIFNLAIQSLNQKNYVTTMT